MTTKGKGKGGKGNGSAKAAKAPEPTPDVTPAVPAAKAEMTPAERFAADLARRNAKGTLTTGHMTFLRNKAREIALAALALGLTALDAIALLGSRYTMDDATLANLTREAERVRNVEGRKTPYYAKRGYARFAFNEGAPALTWAQAEPVITETVNTTFRLAAKVDDAVKAE